MVDHALEAQGATIIRRIDAVDAISMQLVDFGGQDGTTAAAKEFDVTGAFFAQQIVHVFEKFDVPALVTGNGDGLRIFLDGAVHNFGHRAVVAQVNHFCTAALQDAPHDVDGSVVSVEQGSCGYNADVVFRLVHRGLHAGIFELKWVSWLRFACGKSGAFSVVV